MKKGNKRIFTALAAIISCLVFIFTGQGRNVYALSEDGTLPAEDKSEFMQYTTNSVNCFDIRGKYNDDYIMTTFVNAGYQVAIKVGNSTPTEITTLRNGHVRTVDGIDLQMKFNIKQNGRVVEVNYIMQNNSGTRKTVSVGTSGDTKIGSNDNAKVTKSLKMFEMCDDSISSSTYGAKFNITGDFTTTWVGKFDEAYSNMFNNSANDFAENIDSGLAYSWTVDMKAGETVTRTCIFKVDSVLELGDCLVTADVANNRLIVNAPYEYQKDKVQQLNYSIDGGIIKQYGITDTAGENGAGVFDNVAIDIAALNWQPGSSHTISFFIKDVTTANAVLKTRTLTYSVYWPPTTSEGEELKTIKFANSYSLFADIKNKTGAVITLPSDTQNGFAFIGWDTKEDGTGTRYRAGDVYEITGDATLYAQWVAAYKANVNIRLDGNTYDGYTVELKNDIYGTYSNGIAVPNGTYRIFVNGEDTKKTIEVNDAASEVTLDYYSVSYDTAGGSMEYTGTKILPAGSSYEINADIPVKLCRIFNGWKYNGHNYSKGSVISVNSKVVLEADWIENHTFYDDYFETKDGHYRKCSVDGCGYTTPVEAHIYGEYEYNHDATPEADGTMTRKCTLCHHGENIVAAGTAELEKKYKNIADLYSELSEKDITSDDKDTLKQLREYADVLQDDSMYEYLSTEEKDILESVKDYTNDCLIKIDDIQNAKETADTVIDKTLKDAKDAILAMDELTTQEKERGIASIDKKAADSKKTIDNINKISESGKINDILQNVLEQIEETKDNLETINNNIKNSEAYYADEDGNTHYGNISDIIKEAPAGVTIIVRNISSKEITESKDTTVDSSVNAIIGNGKVTVIMSSYDKNNNEDGDIIHNVKIASAFDLIKAAVGNDGIEYIKEGNDLLLRFMVVKIAENVKKQDADVIKKYLEDGNADLDNLKIGEYIDITYEMKKNNENWVKITELDNEIEITIDIPENLKGKEKYYIVRNHNGECTLLSDIDDNPDTITFRTNRFSTYAIVYGEAAKSEDVVAGEKSMVLPVIFLAVSMILMAFTVRFTTSGITRA